MVKIGLSYQPVVFAFWSNLAADTLSQLFEWIQNELKEFFAPASVSIDLNLQLIKVCEEKLKDTKLVVWQHKDTLDLWKLADSLELVDRIVPHHDLISPIESLKNLPFKRSSEGKKEFERLKTEHCDKTSYNKDLIAEFFNVY